MFPKALIIVTIIALVSAFTDKYKKVSNTKIDSKYKEVLLKEPFKAKSRNDCITKCSIEQGCELISFNYENMCSMYTKDTSLMHTVKSESHMMYTKIELKQCFKTQIPDKNTGDCRLRKINDECTSNEECSASMRLECKDNTCQCSIAEFWSEKISRCIGEQYLGCFKEGSPRDLNSVQLFGFSDNTPKNCMRHCSENNYHFAGVQNSNGCFCGNEFGKYGKVENSECSKACSGDGNLKCGAYGRNDVYQIIYNNHTTVTLMGCYKDDHDRDMQGVQVIDKDYINHEYCFFLCKERQYLFAGIEFGRDCFCDNRYGKHGKADISECLLTCDGDSTKKQNCGGSFRNIIFYLKP